MKARRLKGSDGSEMFIGWWDSKLQRDCSFGIAADGATRCLPTEPRRVVQAAYPNELYADAECKQRLGQLAASADCKADALPAVQLWSTTVATPASTCEVNATRVMVVGARLPESAVVYSRKTGACQAVLLTAEQATTGFFVMSELPATDFQAVEPVVDP